MHSSMPSHPSFPPELWSITLGNLRERKSPDELIYLWTTVRQVSCQFKAEIEEIFRTEHLPKTWLYIPNRNSPLLRIQLSFRGPKPTYPARAVFSFSKTSKLPEHARYPASTLRKLRDELRAEQSSESTNANQSHRKGGGRLQTTEACAGKFLIQIRGLLNDCAVTNLHIDPKKHELSIEWKALFVNFFSDKNLTRRVAQSVPTATPTTDPPTPQIPEPIGFTSISRSTIQQLNPLLQPLAAHDQETRYRLTKLSQECSARITRLQSPISTWLELVSHDPPCNKRSSVESCILRQRADDAIDLDTEGIVNEARIESELATQRTTSSIPFEQWKEETSRCDSCRLHHHPCTRESLTPCDMCTSAETKCEFSLAKLSGHTQYQNTRGAMFGGLGGSWGNAALQDYQLQMMLLEQQNRKRLLMAREQDGGGVGGVGGHGQTDLPGGGGSGTGFGFAGNGFRVIRRRRGG